MAPSAASTVVLRSMRQPVVRLNDLILIVTVFPSMIASAGESSPLRGCADRGQPSQKPPACDQRVADRARFHEGAIVPVSRCRWHCPSSALRAVQSSRSLYNRPESAAPSRLYAFSTRVTGATRLDCDEVDRLAALPAKAPYLAKRSSRSFETCLEKDERWSLC